MAENILGLAGTDIGSNFTNDFNTGIIGQGANNFGQNAAGMFNQPSFNTAFGGADQATKSLNETGIMDSISGLAPTLGGLAQLYMQWDQLQAQKTAAQEAHDASATQYNNQLARAKSLGGSVFGPDYKSTQANVAKSSL